MAGNIVFKNGTVYDGRSFLPAKTMVRVSGRMIESVGENVDTSDARIVDLCGGTILPGFIDSHVHPVFAGIQKQRCDVSGYSNLDHLTSTIRRYAATHPDDEWIVGGGWQLTDVPARLRTRTVLDEAAGNRPVFLVNRDAHSAWVNTVALHRAGLDETTTNPPDGRLERDREGNLTGVLHDGAAELVARAIPRTAAGDMDRAIGAGQETLLSFGVTGWQDAIIGDYMGFHDSFDAYLRAANDGRLKARVVGALWWDRHRGVEQLDDLLERRRRAARSVRFTAGTVKMMLDGVPETWTAAMSSPYARGQPRAAAGIELIDPAVLPGYVSRLDANGFQLHFHAVGDRAVTNALDAIAYARRLNGPSAKSHHIAHIQVVDLADINRFADLSATVNMQPYWCNHNTQMDEITIPNLGYPRSTWQYPFRAIYETGARLCAGSDWPVSTPDPLHAIHVAVNRKTLPQGREAGAPEFMPSQSLDRRTALQAYTEGGAVINDWKVSTGRVVAGFDADLAVVDLDLHHVPDQELGMATVKQTWISGELVYET